MVKTVVQHSRQTAVLPIESNLFFIIPHLIFNVTNLKENNKNDEYNDYNLFFIVKYLIVVVLYSKFE